MRLTDPQEKATNLVFEAFINVSRIPKMSMYLSTEMSPMPTKGVMVEVNTELDYYQDIFKFIH